MSKVKEIAIKFSDGELVHFTGDPETSIFDAAKCCGIAVAHDCLNGTCGTCKGSLLDGTVEYNVNKDELSLPSGEGDAVLLCQARPLTDRVDVSLPYSRASLLPKKKRKLKLLSKVRVSATVWDIRCKAEGLRMFDFLPGQYVRLSPAGTEFMRAYSRTRLPAPPRWAS